MFQPGIERFIKPCSNEIDTCEGLEGVGVESAKEEGEGEDVVEYECVGDYTGRSGCVDCV